MNYLSFDPGASGAMCHMTNSNITILDFKTAGIRGYSEYLATIEAPFDMVAVEKVSAMPGQGVKSMFSFGQRLGELEGMLVTLGIGYELVRPQLWQRTCGITPKSGKKGVVATMSKLYPATALLGPKGGILDGRADALGMCHYLRKTYTSAIKSKDLS